MTFVLLMAGLIIIYAIGPMRANFLNAAYGGNISESHFFTRQLVNVLLSIVAFVVAFKVPYEKIRKYGKCHILKCDGSAVEELEVVCAADFLYGNKLFYIEFVIICLFDAVFEFFLGKVGEEFLHNDICYFPVIGACKAF